MIIKIMGVIHNSSIFPQRSSLRCPAGFHFEVSFPDLDLDSGQIGGTLSWRGAPRIRTDSGAVMG